jgi:superfamily I DNA/RNA helicase
MKKKDIHPSDAAVLGSNVDILKDIDYVIRNKYKEKVTTTFETKEVWDYLIDKYEIKNPEELLCASDEVDWEKAMVDKSVFENEIYSIRRNKKFHFWMKTGVMKLSTIHSFKGWESPTLFLVLDETDDFTSPELVYAGLTRCRFRLIIINNQNNTLHNFFTKQIHLNN